MLAFTKKINKIDDQLSGALSSGQVKLVAVSKYASDEQVIEAYNAGQRRFGENYVMPALQRMERLKELRDIEWHLLGALQSNKVKKAVGKFHLIQSIHSIELARLIDSEALSLGIKQNLLLQINLTGDKNGFEPQEIPEVLGELFKLPNIKIQGLMAMAPAVFCETIYQQMRQVFNVVQTYAPDNNFDLSLGMSNDYFQAVQFGSTMIRLGRGLFTGDN